MITKYEPTAKVVARRPTREELLARLREMEDEDIDCSDIPEVKDWSRWMRADGTPVVRT